MKKYLDNSYLFEQPLHSFLSSATAILYLCSEILHTLQRQNKLISIWFRVGLFIILHLMGKESLPRVRAICESKVIIDRKKPTKERRSEAANDDFNIMTQVVALGKCCSKRCWQKINNEMGSMGDADLLPIVSLIKKNRDIVHGMRSKEKHNYMLNAFAASIVRTETMVKIFFHSMFIFIFIIIAIN